MGNRDYLLVPFPVFEPGRMELRELSKGRPGNQATVYVGEHREGQRASSGLEPKRRSYGELSQINYLS